jgi:SAM-dependent methyltransferase
VTSCPKEIVAAGYDACSASYTAVRVSDPSPALTRLLEVLSPRARVLDIGCGAGVPVTTTLAQTADVVGVDISPVQIKEARRNVPNGSFLVGDIMSQTFEPSSFDAIVSFYALFHLPRDEHRPLLDRIAIWLRPGGHLLLTVADADHPGYTEPDFFGATMYWSHFEAGWYASVLRELGFVVFTEDVLGHGYRQVRSLPAERHPVVFAKSPGKRSSKP